jgi:hypothetical protein
MSIYDDAIYDLKDFTIERNALQFICLTVTYVFHIEVVTYIKTLG